MFHCTSKKTSTTPSCDRDETPLVSIMDPLPARRLFIFQQHAFVYYSLLLSRPVLSLWACVSLSLYFLALVCLCVSVQSTIEQNKKHALHHELFSPPLSLSCSYSFFALVFILFAVFGFSCSLFSIYTHTHTHHKRSFSVVHGELASVFSGVQRSKFGVSMMDSVIREG